MTKEFEIIQRTGELFEENSFLCIHIASNDAVLIDPSTEAFDIILKERSIQLKGIILTHAHVDHIYKVDYYVAKYQVPVYVHQLEAKKLKNPELNLSQQMFVPVIVDALPNIVKGAEGSIPFDNFTLTYFLRPGHSEGNIMIKVGDTQVYFVGDSVFKDSIGRYDLPGSNARDHHASLVKFLDQDRKDILYSGHGGKTTVADLDTNMVFQQFIKYGM